MNFQGKNTPNINSLHQMESFDTKKSTILVVENSTNNIFACFLVFIAS
jgi:hypothetical protein